MTEHVVASEDSDKRMKLRYAGPCRLCGTMIPAGTSAVYERMSKTVRCLECRSPDEPPTPASGSVSACVPSPPEIAPVPMGETLGGREPRGAGEMAAPAGPADMDADPAPATQSAVPSLVEEPGAAGASARREYERRRANDEAKIRERWGRLGGIAVALSDEKQSTKAWATGAIGEERLGGMFDGLASDAVAVLHDRRIPGTKANIDHIIVTAGAVWVVDAKRYRGKRPALRIEGGLLRPRTEKLVVGGRDSTRLVDGVLKQVGLVRDVVGEVPVRGALCFVDADWPLIGGAFATRGVQVLWPKLLRKQLTEPGQVTLDVTSVRDALATHFPPS